MPYIPSKEEIRAEALKIYFRENPEARERGLIPEDDELEEENFFRKARSRLMTSPAKQEKVLMIEQYHEMISLAEEKLEELGEEREEERLRKELKKSTHEIINLWEKLREMSREREEERRKAEEEIRRMREEAEKRVRLRMVTVRILKDIPSFVGQDFKVYGPFKAGDIVSLPEGNAAAFIEGRAAEPWVLAPPKPVVPEWKRPLRDFPERASRLRQELLSDAEDSFRFYNLLGEYPKHRDKVVEMLETFLNRNLDKPYLEAERLTSKEFKSWLYEYIKPLRPALPPVPPRPRELSLTEIRTLEAEFKSKLERELGRVPRGAIDDFRLEIENVKALPYEEAKRRIDSLADGIIRREAREVVRPPKRIIPYRPPPEEEVPAVYVPPVEVPKYPLSKLPFGVEGRSPTSEEKEVLWNAFVYRVLSVGGDPYAHADWFKERISTWSFANWEQVLRNFDELIKDVEAGRLRPRIEYGVEPMPWRKKRAEENLDAVCHIVVHIIGLKQFEGKDITPEALEEVIDKLRRYGIFVDEEEVKDMAKRGWKEKNRAFIATSKKDLEKLLGETIESSNPDRRRIYLK